MARSRQLEQPAVPRSVSSRSGTTRSKPALAALIASALVAFWALTMLTGVGRIAYVYVFVYLDFYIGVVSLVSMSLTVMAGVLSTDRLVLMIRHRVLLQSVHRVTGIIAVGALGMHILVKLASGYVGLLEAFIPFISGRGLQGVYIGLGTLAAYAMASVLWTGLIRARFVGVGRPWVWRALHSVAYASWPFALVHGLKAGRAAATWVTVSYILCVVAVVIALLVRLAVSVGRKRKDVAPSSASAAAKPAAKPAADGAETRVGFGSSTRRSVRDIRADRERSERYVRTGPPDPLTDSWIGDPASRVGPPRRRSGRFAVPEVPVSAAAQVSPSEPEAPWDSPQRWSQRSRVAVEEPTPGRRRRVEEDERPTRYARAEEDRYSRADEERTARHDRDETRSTVYTSSYASVDDEEAERPERFAPTRRWSEPEEVSATEPRRSRSARHSEEEPVAPRRSRSARHSRDDEYDEVAPPRRRTPRYAPDDDERPRYVARDETPIPADDETPTLVDLASRRAKRAAAAAAEGGTIGGRSRRRRAATADAVDEAYWRSLRGEAQ